MKICFITANLTGGGAERVIANLSNQMVALGHEVTILLTAGREIAYEFDPQIEIIQISSRTSHSIKGRISRIRNLRNYFKKNKDTCFIAMPTDTNMFALVAGLGLGINLTISERNDPNAYHYIKLRNMIYLFAKKIVFQTEDAKHCYSKRLQERGCVIQNPISGVYPEPYTGERKKKIVAAGRLEPQKNHKMMIEAFAKISEKYPEYELWIYGKGSLEAELKKQCEQLGLSDKVVFPGFSEHVRDEIYDAAMYVLSSNFEGISNSLLEAMALGTSVISTDCPIGGSKMLIDNKKNGLLTPIADAQAFADAIEYYLDDSNRAAKMGAEASKVKEEYKIEVITQKWLDYIRK